MNTFITILEKSLVFTFTAFLKQRSYLSKDAPLSSEHRFSDLLRFVIEFIRDEWPHLFHNVGNMEKIQLQ